jgi:signal transduction histidine kinase
MEKPVLNLNKKLPSKISWTVLGILFGFAFPLIAYSIRLYQFGIQESRIMLQHDPVLWIIMTAPVFLGLFAFLGGKENDRVRQIQETLEKINIESSKMALLGEMAGGIAHEINNPLTIILGKSSILRTRLKGCMITPEDSKEKIFEDITKIEKTSERIGKIIKGLKSFSRKSENDEKTNFPISQLIEDTLELRQDKLKKIQ